MRSALRFLRYSFAAALWLLFGLFLALALLGAFGLIVALAAIVTLMIAISLDQPDGKRLLVERSVATTETGNDVACIPSRDSRPSSTGPSHKQHFIYSALR